MKQLIQIENLQADDLLSRLERIENAILSLQKQNGISKEEASEYIREQMFLVC